MNALAPLTATGFQPGMTRPPAAPPQRTPSEIGAAVAPSPERQAVIAAAVIAHRSAERAMAKLEAHEQAEMAAQLLALDRIAAAGALDAARDADGALRASQVSVDIRA